MRKETADGVAFKEPPRVSVPVWLSLPLILTCFKSGDLLNLNREPGSIDMFSMYGSS